MGTIGRDFTARVTLVGPIETDRTVEVELLWTINDPYAVTARFTEGESNDPSVWVFDRGLMVAGMSTLRAIGRGDVKFRRQPPSHGGGLEACLHTPEGHAHVEMPGEDVAKFLRETLGVCPFGTEGNALDIDAELKELLG